MRASHLIPTLFLFLSIGFAASKPTPDELMEKNRLAQQFRSLEATCLLETSGGTRRAAQKEFLWKRLRQDNGLYFDTLTTFKSPAEIKGQAILFLERANNQNEISMYLPTYKKVRRVEASQQKTSFMSSDFSYADMTTFQNKEYNYRELKEEKCPTKDASSVVCRAIEAEAKEEATKNRTGYGKSVVWVRVDQNTTTQVEHYDLKGTLVKRLIFENSELKGKGDQGQDLYFAKHLVMHSLSDGQKTELHFSKVQINVALRPSLFSLKNLGK